MLRLCCVKVCNYGFGMCEVAVVIVVVFMLLLRFEEDGGKEGKQGLRRDFSFVIIVGVQMMFMVVLVLWGMRKGMVLLRFDFEEVFT